MLDSRVVEPTQIPASSVASELTSLISCADRQHLQPADAGSLWSSAASRMPERPQEGLPEELQDRCGELRGAEGRDVVARYQDELPVRQQGSERARRRAAAVPV